MALRALSVLAKFYPRVRCRQKGNDGNCGAIEDGGIDSMEFKPRGKAGLRWFVEASAMPNRSRRVQRCLKGRMRSVTERILAVVPSRS